MSNTTTARRRYAVPTWVLAVIALFALVLLFLVPLPAANADELPAAPAATAEEPAPAVEEPPVVVEEPVLVDEAPAARVATVAFVPHAESARWLLPASWDYGTTPSYQAAIFPQDVLLTDPPACRWSQDDNYWIENEAEQAIFDALDDDGVLTQGEDSAIYASHVFTQGPKCEVPAEQCVSSNAWGTEEDDTEPVLTDEGLVFDGGSGAAVGYGTPLTGNLQGLGEITVTAAGDLDVFYPRIVINSLADGGYAYDSLTVISEGPVNGSSIAASNKRGFEQHTLDEWAALLPGNQLVAFFLHLDSGATADQSVTVTAVDGECFSLDLVTEPETPEEPTPPTSVKAGDFQPSPLLYPLAAALLAALAAAGARRAQRQ